MAARKRGARAVGSLAGKKASVCVQRGGASIQIDGVPADEAGLVLADILAAFRVLGAKFKEMRDVPDTIPGGYPTHVPDEYWDEEEGRVGFRVTS
jgi:hypothetical protein